MEDLFVYDSLMQSESQERAIGRVDNAREGILLGYRRVEKLLDGEFLDDVVKSNSCVKGLVLSVTKSELESADKYQGEEYTRIKGVLDDKSYAWFYKLKPQL